VSDVQEGAVAFADRAADAITGSTFVAEIMDLPLGEEREERIKSELLAGNVPSWFRQALAVPVSHEGHTGIFFALPDYLAVGDDEDFVRVPMNPLTAQAVADSVGCLLPTRAMVNSIWAAALMKLTYKNLPPTAEMTSTKWFSDHNVIVQVQLSGHSPGEGLVAGHKKDVVLCKAFENDAPYPEGHGDRVAIYGWCKAIHQDDSWEVIQELNPSSHNNRYADYSHGIRLICAQMLVDNEYRAVAEVLADPDLSGLLSDEGALSVSRYPGT
jgi:hypothetical protein